MSAASLERAPSFRSIEQLSQAEFEGWRGDYAPELGKAELIHGYIVRSPPPAPARQSAVARLSARLGAHVKAKRLGDLFDARTAYALPTGDTLAPDLSFVSKARLCRVPRSPAAGLLRTVPNLAVEIVAPGTRARDLRVKREIYERSAVNEYWVLDPEQRRLRTFRLVRGALVETAESVSIQPGILRSRAVRGFVLSEADLFA